MSLGSLICPLRHQSPPTPNVPLHHEGPNFPFSPSGHLPPVSPNVALLRVSNFPIASSKGPKFSIAPSRAPNFLIMLSKWWPLISHHIIKGSQFIIGSSLGSIVTSNFPSHYQGVPIYYYIIKGPHFPNCVIKGTQISKIHPSRTSIWDMYWSKSDVFKIIIEIDIHVQSLSRVYVGRGQRNKLMKYRGTAPESLSSMGPESPHYASESPVSRKKQTWNIKTLKEKCYYVLSFLVH